MIGFSGCQKPPDEEIRSYSIPKTEAVYEANHVDVNTEKKSPPRETTSPSVFKEKHRLIGALVRDGNSIIYFKLKGPSSKLASAVEPFSELMKSFKIENGAPTWTLPKGWRQLPDNSPRNNGAVPRLATILVDENSDDLELTVTRLGYQGDYEQSVLANLNRWRDQVSLPPIKDIKNLYTDPKDNDAEQEIRKISMNGRTIIFVHLIGYPKQGRPGMPPFFRG